MNVYAANTTVSVESSRGEIERILRRYKAEAFAYGTEANRAQIGFKIAGRYVRFLLTMPDPEHADFTVNSRGRRAPDAAEKLWEQACRQKWRALALVIKAKLEAVSAGITTIEDEFLAHTVLPDNTTVGEWMRPQVDEAYRLGSMPSLLQIAGPA